MNESDKSAVKNAADPQQVRRAGARDRDKRADEIEAFRALLALPAGRRAFWALLERAGVFRSVWDQSGQRIAYNAGRQDFGHELMAVLLEADEGGFAIMAGEAAERQRREVEANQAAHTPRAGS